MERPIQPRWLEYVIVPCATMVFAAIPLFAIAVLCGAATSIVLGTALPIAVGVLGLLCASRVAEIDPA